MGTDAILEHHLAANPDVLEQLNLARDAAWSVVDNRLLGLCEQRIREISDQVNTLQGEAASRGRRLNEVRSSAQAASSASPSSRLLYTRKLR